MLNYFLFFIFLLVSYCYSDSNIDFDKLSNDPTWLKLLHYDQKIKKSTVLSDDFFISSNGKNSPKDELKATIDAYFEDNITNKSPICKFPARYFWLSKKIKLPNYQIVHPKCTKLSKWSILKNTKSISLLFVSGYLGNPASAFGHSFLKLNQKIKKSKNDLFDLSINYGALVPENEPTFIYIYNGLTGGYQAGFSDKYYYIQDLVYSNTEFRDIWNYELNLENSKQQLLLLHIWEIVGKKFQYFFLNKNCAYAIAKLLELAIKEPIVEHATYWYAPIETFHKLKAINTKYPLIKKVTYIPSEQKIVYKHYKHLSAKSKKIVKKIINNTNNNLPTIYLKASTNQKIESIDFVLSYYKYLLIKNKEDNATITKKDRLLLERLKLPPKNRQKIILPKRLPPDFDNKPIRFALGVDYINNIRHFVIKFSPFAIETIGQNTLDGDQLIVLDGTIKVDKKFNHLFLDSFDFIKIRKFQTIQLPFKQENPWSWQIDLGVKRVYFTNNRYDLFIDGGIGRAIKIDHVTLFSLINFSAHTTYPNIRLRPNFGTFLNFKKLRALFWIGYENSNSLKTFKQVYQFEGTYKISKNFDIFFTHSFWNKTKNSSFGFKLFF